MSRNVPQLKIEQYVLGELSAEQAHELEATLGAEVLAMEIEAIERSNAAVLAKLPPRVFAAAVEQRAAARPAPARFSWGLVAVPAMALLAAIVVVPQVLRSGPADGVEITRQKGVPALSIYRQQAAGAEFLERGDAVGPGDVLQLSYAAAGAEFGAVVSVDGNGVITWHLPRNGSKAVRLNNGTVPLDHSYELDDAPAFERFVFVTGPMAFDLLTLERALDGWDGGELHLEPSLSATVFDVSKPGTAP